MKFLLLVNIPCICWYDHTIICWNICCIVEYFKSSQFRLLSLLQLRLKLISVYLNGLCELHADKAH